MLEQLQSLTTLLERIFASKVTILPIAHEQLTIIVKPDDLTAVMQQLRDHQNTSFVQCLDLAAIDYQTYANLGAHLVPANTDGKRFAVSYQLLSLQHNWRLTVKVFIANDEVPELPSLCHIWQSLNWFEREAFDLFGIFFTDHPDLRRILTDYGFVGNPLRKDFPLSGFVEIKYDEVQHKIIQQGVSIEPREIVPRVVRKDYDNARD